jgi:hypothetical protein
MEDFLSVADATPDQLIEILDLARRLKGERAEALASGRSPAAATSPAAAWCWCSKSRPFARGHRSRSGSRNWAGSPCRCGTRRSAWGA